MRTALIIAPDESCELGVIYQDNKLIAGHIYNAGISHDFTMDYDQDLTFEENLNTLCDIIIKNWEYDKS